MFTPLLLLICTQSVPSRKTGIFSEQPFRQPMSAFLTSLPQPEETAQSLLMKERRRRSSISNMFRKFSKTGKMFKKGEGESGMCM